MVPRATIVAAVAALALAGSAAGSRVLVQGPVLAGDAVLWGEQGDTAASLHLWTPTRGDRVVVSDDKLSLSAPPAASAKLIAFARSYPSCPPQPGIACPQEGDVLAGPVAGPFRPVAPPTTCFSGTDTFAVDAGVVAYARADCTRNVVQVVVRDVLGGGAGRVVVEAPASSGCCFGVALAGRYVAWTNQRAGGVVVYDWRARRLVYRAVTPSAVELGFDLARDGSVAVAYRPPEFARNAPATIAWFSRASPRAHVLGVHANTTTIRFAANRIAFERTSAGHTELLLADPAGRVQTVTATSRPLELRASFDFDGRQLVWVTDRIDSTRVDCPPPGQGRPCVLRKSGVTTISRRSAAGGPIRRIAQLRFDDAIGVGGVPRRVR